MVVPVGAAVDGVIDAGDLDGVADVEVLVAAGVGVRGAEVAGDRRRHDGRIGRHRAAVDDVAQHEIVGVVDVTVLQVVEQPQVDRRILGHAPACPS